ncbi:MAG: hypothetical protein LBP72_01445 [Dysgonamonadaceae bacterium]|jgi:hypothetical protein|nr:hypothetical protein [Dysgonamonadaceae bacterium]
MDEKLKTVIEGIIKKCKERQIAWSKTSGNGFVLFLLNSTIEISRVFYSDPYDQEAHYYSIKIYNNDGDQIDCLSSYEENSDSDISVLLKELYECASKSYYRIDETYESIIDEIKNSDFIGKKEKIITSDYLPF